MEDELNATCELIKIVHHQGLEEHLFLNEESSDCQIIVSSGGDKYRYPTHKSVLCEASPFFALHLSNAKVMVFNNVKPQVIFLVLRYIYQGTIELDILSRTIDILHAAQKFKLVKLAIVCEQYLSQELSLDNVCVLLAKAYSYRLDYLKSKCLMLCAVGACIILKKTSFRQLKDKEVVKAIVSLPELNVQGEMHLLKGLWSWAKLECCRKSKKLTENNIFSEFKQFVDFINFEDITLLELYGLPECFSPIISKLNLRNLPNYVASSYFPKQRSTVYFTEQVLKEFDSIQLNRFTGCVYSEYCRLIPSKNDTSMKFLEFEAGKFTFSNTVILGGVEICFKSRKSVNSCPIHFIILYNGTSQEEKTIEKMQYKSVRTLNGKYTYICKFFTDVIVLESGIEYAFRINCSKSRKIHWHCIVQNEIFPLKTRNYSLSCSSNVIWAIQTLFVCP